jgi:hypothetical protein
LFPSFLFLSSSFLSSILLSFFLYSLSVSFPFFCRTGDWTQVLCLLGKHSTNWATPFVFKLLFR